MRYRVQRPFTEWAEVVIENADNLDHALELADKQFEEGDWVSVELSYSLDFDRYWAIDEDDKTHTTEGN
jgi:hypothetical protein